MLFGFIKLKIINVFTPSFNKKIQKAFYFHENRYGEISGWFNKVALMLAIFNSATNFLATTTLAKKFVAELNMANIKATLLNQPDISPYLFS